MTFAVATKAKGSPPGKMVCRSRRWWSAFLNWRPRPQAAWTRDWTPPSLSRRFLDCNDNIPNTYRSHPDLEAQGLCMDVERKRTTYNYGPSATLILPLTRHPHRSASIKGFIWRDLRAEKCSHSLATTRTDYCATTQPSMVSTLPAMPFRFLPRWRTHGSAPPYIGCSGIYDDMITAWKIGRRS